MDTRRVTTALIVQQLPRIVAEHRALVKTLGLRGVVSHRASFLLDVSDAECLSLPDAEIGGIFDLYLTECEKQKAYDAAVATALCQNVRKAHRVKGMIPLLASNAFEEALQVLAKRGHWALVLELVRSRPNGKLHGLLREVVSAWGGVGTSSPKLEECLEVLLARCTDHGTLGLVAERLVLECRGAALDTLLARHDVDPARFCFRDASGWPLNILGLVAGCLVGESKGRDTTAPRVTKGLCGEDPSDYRSLLVRAVEAGLTSQLTTTCQHVDAKVPLEHRPTPLVRSAFSGMLDLVKLFHETGATTNKELFELSAHEDFRSSQTSGGTESTESTESTRRQEVADYVCQAASHPRRLESLCAFQISRCIGCRADRTLRAGKLPVSSVLLDGILFRHALDKYTV